MTTHGREISEFVSEVRADPEFSVLAELFHAGLSEADRIADNSVDHAEFFRGLQHIFTKQSRPLNERINKLIEFDDLRKGKDGLVVVDLREFCGW
jgi:hypothetical protein